MQVAYFLVCLTKLLKKKFTILQFKDAIRFAISYILYLNKKIEYSTGHFALKWLHYICVNFDTHKLVHTWKCHLLPICLRDILPEKCLSYGEGYLKFVSISTKIIVVKFFIMYSICEINEIFVSSNSESQEREQFKM